MIEALGPSVHRRLRILRYGVPLAAAVSALFWGLLTYSTEIRTVTEESVRNAELIKQYTERLVQTQTILQQAARNRARSEPEAFLRSEEFHRFLADIEKAQPFTEGIGVVAEDGTIVANSRAFPISARIDQRDYLAAASGGTPVYIDRLLLEANGQDAFVVATPFQHLGFRGAIVSAVSIDLVRNFLIKVANEPGDAASLLREDGLLLVRNVPSKPLQLPPQAVAFEAIRAADHGSFETVAVSDNVRRIYSYTRVGEFPLFANFGVPRAHAVASWLGKVLPVWALLSAIGLFTFLMAGQIGRSMKARFLAEANARRLDEAERLAEQRRQLMNEMNHRVKNNLALVAALIGMQMRSQGKVDGNELQARVMAISEVHELLHRAPDAYEMDFGDVLTRLCASPAIVPHERPIRVHTSIETGIVLSPDSATALALSAAEVMTNAVKHAFAGRAQGNIHVTLARSAEGALLEIRDDGVGLPPVTARSSGLRIVDGLVAQVGGKLERITDKGTCVRIRFPLDGGGQTDAAPRPAEAGPPVRAAS